MTGPLLFTFAGITCTIMRREYKGNYEKPNCKMWSAITFERMTIPIHTLFSFSRVKNISFYENKRFRFSFQGGFYYE